MGFKPEDLGKVAQFITLGETFLSQIVGFIGHIKAQSGLSDQEIADLAQKHNDEAKAAIDALGTQSSN
jgi:hypothetical protein